MVYSLSLKMLADTEEARDLVQDTFLKVWQHIGRYDERYSLSTWIYTIASRLCLDRLRHDRMRRQTPQDEEVFARIASEPDTGRRFEASEWVSVVKVLARDLPAKQRLVFTLSCLEGLDTARIMQITGLNEKQIKSNLHVARKHIRKHLTEMGYGQDR
ncbi:MAG: sigma-70 family RNA polymerase sigma factor [Bacteroidales bacterium]|nr:sigma-70 family RNA polymerase sigma factor [Bacteroidales bacterium]